MPRCIIQKKYFVLFKSIYPEEDELAQWLDELNLLNRIRQDIIQTEMHMGLDQEQYIRERLKLPLNSGCLALFSKLIQDSNGIILKELGLDSETCKNAETFPGKLHEIKLVRVQHDILLKPLKRAFDPRIQFLVGAKKVPFI